MSSETQVYKGGVIGKFLLPHLIKKPPKSDQQLSIVLRDRYDWIPKAPKAGIISLLILGVFPCNKGGKEPKKKERMKEKKKVKIVNNPFYFQQYLLVGNIKARIIHSRNKVK